MRYLFLLFIFFINSFSDELTDKMDKLLQNNEVKKIILLKYNPFIQEDSSQIIDTNTKTITKKKVIKPKHLVSIINKRAFINTKWFSEGDFIDAYKITYIYSDSVLLKKQNKEMTLKFEQKNILKF